MRQRRTDRGDQPGARIGGDQLHIRPAVGDEPASQCQPPGAVFGRGHVQAEDCPVPVGVDSNGDQGVHIDHPTVFAHLDYQRIGPDEGVQAGIQRRYARAAWKAVSPATRS